MLMIANVSADSCLTGKVCGDYPRTFCCPENNQCGTYTDRLCYTESNGPTAAGIICIVVIGLFILFWIFKACYTCYCSRNGYQTIPSSDPSYLSRSGAVVCTVAATSQC
ncbi:unnamed protein product [Adineta ricciae]|uniref:Uncharacterized protein n=1 Tax=Adineta ricciae TaxID=249248 RepID=A0A814TIT6_ADIRI|nr:unnamed protein product [Adineta ricciae]